MGDYPQPIRMQMAKSGQAMSEGEYPIGTGARGVQDLKDAILAVGRARPNTPERRREVRRHIMRNAQRLNQMALIPDTWRANGSLTTGND